MSRLGGGTNVSPAKPSRSGKEWLCTARVISAAVKNSDQRPWTLLGSFAIRIRRSVTIEYGVRGKEKVSQLRLAIKPENLSFSLLMHRRYERSVGGAVMGFKLSLIRARQANERIGVVRFRPTPHGARIAMLRASGGVDTLCRERVAVSRLVAPAYTARQTPTQVAEDEF